MSALDPVRAAFAGFADRLIGLLPALVTALVLVVAGWLVGRLLAAAARRLMARLRVGAMMERAGWRDALARAEIETGPAEILARLVFWIVFVVFLVLAVENLGLDFTAVPLHAFIAYLPRVLGAVVLLFVGSTLAMLLSRALGASLAKIRFEQHRTLAAAVRWLVLLVTLMVTIEHLGFDVTFLAGTLTNLLTLFFAGLVVTFALGGKEVARNLLAGYYARERFRAGDVLALPEGEGRLEEIGTLTAELRLETGSLVVPNRVLVETPVLRKDRAEDERAGG